MMLHRNSNYHLKKKKKLKKPLMMYPGEKAGKMVDDGGSVQKKNSCADALLPV